MTAYKIKYFRTGLMANLFPMFFPDSITIIIGNNAEEAIDKFYAKFKNHRIYDLKGIK